MVLSTKKNHHQKGFLLIESLVAVSLLTIVMIGGFSANNLAANTVSINKLRNQANLLAREGVEALYSVKSADFPSLTIGTFHPVLNAGSWTLVVGEETIGKHKRKITLSPVMRHLICSTPVCDIIAAGGKTDQLTYKATVEVSWTEDSTDKSYQINTLITYWR